MGNTTKDNSMAVHVGEVTPPTYNIEISWDSMEFTYQETINYIWDPNTHAYELTTPTYNWETTNNNINIENKSNIIINVELNYVSDNETIDGEFDISKTTIKQNERIISKLTLDGKLTSNNTEYIKIGKINLTIS